MNIISLKKEDQKSNYEFDEADNLNKVLIAM